MDMLHIFKDTKICDDDYYMHNSSVVGLYGMPSKLGFECANKDWALKLPIRIGI